MPCATTLYFDLETDAAIRRIWQAIEDAGLPSSMLNLGYRPHLTLAVCESMNLEALRGELPRLVSSIRPVPLTFYGLGTFNIKEGVVFLGVTATQTLLDLHEQFWRLSVAHADGNHTYYQPGIWVPHITLGYGLQQDQVGQVITALLKIALPASGIATELVVTDVSPSGYVDLFAARLGSPLSE